MAVIWHTGEVTENEVLGHKFRVVKLKVLDDPALLHIAGQFILMRMGKPTKVNSYSMSNVPRRGVIETLIDITPADFEPPAGAGSRYIRDLVAGDRVEFAGPSGNFVVKDDGARELWFVATGSGISSFWSMIRDQLEKDDKRVIRLWWGLRYEDDLIWENELNEFVTKYPNFSFEYVLSQPREEDEWLGKRGHVTEHILAEVGNLSEKKLSEVSLYLCGNNLMIQQVSAGVNAMGVPKERVHWEKYF